MPKRSRNLPQHIWAGALALSLLSSCAHVSVDKKKDAATTTTTSTTTDTTSAPTPAPDPSTFQVGQMPTSVAGPWQLTFLYKKTTMQATMQLEGSGESFTGTGKDSNDGAPFKIDQGHIKDGQMRFYKKYTTKNFPSVEYTGKIEVVQEQGYKGPRMSGEYTAPYQGNIVSGMWSADMVFQQDATQVANAQQGGQGGPAGGAQGQQGGPPQGGPGGPGQGDQGGQQGGPQGQQGGPGGPQDQGGQQPPAGGQDNPPADHGQQGNGDQGGGAPPPDQGGPPADAGAAAPLDHSPDISGKWTVGYVFNFKTMHSSMYLEQDGDRVTGHGVDENTREKFVIEKGWYHYPKLTIIRKYLKKAGASRDYSMTFKADVSIVKDSDYQGPYLNGETQGGGKWEAQLVK